MIDFEHKLPAMNIDGKENGTYNNVELALPGILTTTDYRLGEFLHTLRSSIYSERALVFVDGKALMVNKNWIRDHVHTMKGMKHFEYNMQKYLDFTIETQREDGQYYELIKQMDDFHIDMVDENCKKVFPDDNVYIVRLELEADIEYLIVEGVMQCYRVNGDDAWLKWALPHLEKGINYITSDKNRWDEEHGLVKRPFTIDTWDFKFKPEKHLNRRIEDGEEMSIMHGDNSGVYKAMNQLAWFNRRLGHEQKALEWEHRAAQLRENMMKYLWNGKFFTHQLHLNHNGVDDKESLRLSLSNTYDINRGITTIEQSRSIIEEYMQRRETTDKFAEWFTIDPPYEKFCLYEQGVYVNGAVSPFTAGELSKAAFENGYEEYGWDIISRFISLAERDGRIYFLYHPDSRPHPELGPCAWGSAALMYAVDEGLAGIVDKDIQYGIIDFSPRFPVTHYKELRYLTGYEKADVVVDVKYIVKEDGMRYDIKSPARTINAHILLPKGKTCTTLYVDGVKQEFGISSIGDSSYVDYQMHQENSVALNKNVSFELLFS